MLAIAVSLLFTLAALLALAVIRVSLIRGTRRWRLIVAELDAIERETCVMRLRPAGPTLVLRPALAAA